MSKQIRPLVAYKKAYPEKYNRIDNVFSYMVTSKKGKENIWYWTYALFEITSILDIRPENYFFFKTPDVMANKGTIAELGRLLLTGWYYGEEEEEFTKKVCKWVYRAYKQKEGAFNDLEYKKAVQHIREDIGYYFHNQERAKLYLLEEFFSDELKPLLPEKPFLLEVLEIKKRENEQELKGKTKQYFRNKHENLEYVSNSYIEYLQKILFDVGIYDFVSYDDWKQKEEDETNEIIKEIIQAQNDYKGSLFENEAIQKLLD